MGDDCNRPLAAQLGVNDESASSLALLHQQHPPRLAHHLKKSLA
jgi:hypothetical protein